MFGIIPVGVALGLSTAQGGIQSFTKAKEKKAARKAQEKQFKQDREQQRLQSAAQNASVLQNLGLALASIIQGGRI